MFSFFKNSDRFILQKKLQILFILNLTCLFMSLIINNSLLYKGLYLLTYDYISSNLILILAQGIIPALLLFLISHIISNAKKLDLFFSNIFSNLLIITTLFLNILCIYILDTQII